MTRAGTNYNVIRAACDQELVTLTKVTNNFTMLSINTPVLKSKSNVQNAFLKEGGPQCGPVYPVKRLG